MAKKTKLTIDQHIKIAQSLCPARDFLSSLVCTLHKAYPLSHRVLRQAIKADKAVDELRCMLENYMDHENKMMIFDDSSKIYYGEDNEIRQGKTPIRKYAKDKA